MKIRSLASLLLAFCLAAGGAALSASADPVAYAVLENGVLTFRYDENKPIGDNVWDFPINSQSSPSADNSPWKSVADTITSVVVDASMRDYTIGRFDAMGLFNGCINLTSITGLDNFDVSSCTRISGMFNNCRALTEIDMSRWENEKTSFYLQATFNNCMSLTTIYVSEKFKPEFSTANNTPFNWSDQNYKLNKLVGGNGTVWNNNYKGYTRAVIDRTDQPGYFTGRTWIDIDFAGGEGEASAVSYELTTESIANPNVVELGVPTKDGYVFDGWELPTEQVEDGVTADKITGHVTVPADYLKAFSVTALWKEAKGPEGTYTIAYYLGNVRYADKDEEYTYSTTEDHVLAFTDPVVSVGMMFAGWHDNPECMGDVVTKIVAGTYGYVALYAGETPIGPTTLVWNGSVDSDWMNGRNWTPNKVPTADDDVRFSGSPVPVRLVSGMSFKSFELAGDVIFDVPTDYTLNFVIGGTGNITKIGVGKLTVSAANTYVGTLTVLEGTVYRSNAQAFGLADNAIVVSNATLNLGAYNNKNVRHALTLEEGAVLDASGNLQGYSGLSSVTLTGNASIRSDSSYATPPTICNGVLMLNGHTLAKIGTGSVQLAGTAFVVSDSGTLDVQEGLWRDSYGSSTLLSMTNMVLKLGGGAAYYETQNLAWGCFCAANSSWVTCNNNYYLRVRDEISGGLTVQNLHLNNGCVYKPLAAGDCLVVSNNFEVTSQGKFSIDVSGLDPMAFEHRQQLPLLITPTEVPKTVVSEVRTVKGKWPIYTKLREDGMYELGVTVKNGGLLLLFR